MRLTGDHQKKFENFFLNSVFWKVFRWKRCFLLFTRFELWCLVCAQIESFVKLLSSALEAALAVKSEREISGGTGTGGRPSDYHSALNSCVFRLVASGPVPTRTLTSINVDEIINSTRWHTSHVTVFITGLGFFEMLTIVYSTARTVERRQWHFQSGISRTRDDNFKCRFYGVLALVTKIETCERHFKFLLLIREGKQFRVEQTRTYSGGFALPFVYLLGTSVLVLFMSDISNNEGSNVLHWEVFFHAQYFSNSILNGPKLK